jgi:hypothetical protein
MDDVRKSRPQDLARSLLMMVTQQIAQLSYHVALAQGCTSEHRMITTYTVVVCRTVPRCAAVRIAISANG